MSDVEDAAWHAKVEYVVDLRTATVHASLVKDLDEETLPSFDVGHVYRVFWSPVDEETPMDMLKRVPVIPDLTPEQELDGEAGYYRAHVLAIRDDPKKFEESRVRKTVNRGQGKEVKTKKSSRKRDTNGSNETKAESRSRKAKASRLNLPTLATSDNFEEFDNDLHRAYSSDDYEDDPTLVPDAQVKVLTLSVKSLKKRLLEKCAEIEDMRKIVEDKDTELATLRRLNTQLQERLLDSLSRQQKSNLLSSSSNLSSRSPSNSSLASDQGSFKFPLSRSHSNFLSSPCSNGFAVSRSRSISLSSVGSETSELGSSAKRKGVPPSSPLPSAKKILSSSDTDTPRRDNSTNGPRSLGMLNDSTPENTHERSIDRQVLHENTPDAESQTKSSSVFDLSPLANSLSGEDDTTLTSITSPAGAEAMVTGDQHEDASSNNPEDRPVMVEFLKNYLVKKVTLQQVDSTPLQSSSDGTFVRECACMVFGLRVLYNSSIRERTFKNKETDARKKLDPDVVEEIRKRLQDRVYKEFDNKVPADQLVRFKLATVNRIIYKKIQQLRRNTAFEHLDDFKKKSAESAESGKESVPS